MNKFGIDCVYCRNSININNIFSYKYDVYKLMFLDDNNISKTIHLYWKTYNPSKQLIQSTMDLTIMLKEL